jgi:hypothetical protein
VTSDGWKRLWIVNTVAWVGYWLFSAGKTFYDYGWTKDAWEVLALYLELALLPPFVLFVAGLLVDRVFLGLKPKT